MKKFVVLFLALVVVAVIANILPSKQYARHNVWLKENNNNKPLIIAHAGGRLYHPGNTIKAFKYAADLGVDVLEMDVHLTQDRVLVLRHGENNTGNIRAMSNCDAVIWKKNYRWLYENCNFGYNFQNTAGEYPYRGLTQPAWVEQGVYLTTLDEVFSTFGKDILYNIEVKSDADAPGLDTAQALCELITAHDLSEHVLAATAYEEISQHLRSNCSNLYVSASQAVAQDSIIKTYSFTDILFEPGQVSTLQLPVSFEVPLIKQIKLATRLLIQSAQSKNMAVHYWTINDAKTMAHLHALGADGIITDDPITAMRVIND